MFAHADDVKRDFGTAHLVVNNAGATVVGTVEHLSIEEIEWQLGINLWGVIYGTKAFLPMMLAQREGCIVNISSVFGLVGFPLQSAYNISKFGVRGLTECLWSELDGHRGARSVRAPWRHQDQHREGGPPVRGFGRRGGRIRWHGRQDAADPARVLRRRHHFRGRARKEEDRYREQVEFAVLAEPAVAERLSGHPEDDCKVAG